MAEKTPEPEDNTSDDNVSRHPIDRARREEARRRSRSRGKKKRGPRSGDLFLVVIIAALLLVFFIKKPGEILQYFYNQTAGLILIIMVVEYLVLKSMDRTRVFQLENYRLRESRRADRQLLKRSRELIDERAEADADQWDEEDEKRWRKKANLLSEDIRDSL